MDLDLTTLTSDQYANGAPVIGDLTKLGWQVFRSFHIHSGVESEIRNICGRGDWHTIDKHRLMKYQTSTHRPPRWKEGKLKEAFAPLSSNILNYNLPTEDYQFEYINVLKILD